MRVEAKRALRSARRGLMGLLPARAPDFIIIGAQKAGTSTLHHWLDQHPGFRGSTPKEIHYFDRWVHWGRDRAWYESHFDRLTPLYRRSFRNFESTPQYLYDAD